MIVVLMGVSGSGKTTIGVALAGRVGCAFADADDYHSPANKSKMAAGTPLNDEDRAPWLKSLNDVLRGWKEQDQSGVLACSALKDKYRDELQAGLLPDVVKFVLLDAPKEILIKRMIERKHEYMNPALLDSQIATLERPKVGIVVMNDHPVEQVVDEILQKVKEGK